MEVLKAQWPKFKGKNHSVESRRKMMLNGCAKLTKEQVMEMRQLYENGELQKNLSVKYNISMQSISKIVNNKRYKLWG